MAGILDGVNILLKVFRFAGSLWPYYLGVTVLSVMMALTSLATPFLIKEATDLIVGALTSNERVIIGVLWIAAGLFVVDVLNTLFTNWGGYLGDVMSQRLKKQLSERYYQHLLSLPQSYFDHELTGTIISRLNRTIEEMTRFINMFANTFFQMFITIGLSLIVVLFYSWELALLLTILYPIFIWLTMLTSKKWQAWQAEKNLEIDIASGRFAEVVAQIKVVKSFIYEKLEYASFSKRHADVVSITRRQSSYWHNMDIFRRLVLNVIFFAIFAYIFVYTIQGRFSIGDMVLLIQLVTMMRMPIFSMSMIIDGMQRAIAGSRDYFEVMEIKPAVADSESAKDMVVTKAGIEYKNVSFAYDGDRTILHDITFDVKPGEKVALVGESGEGKSTLTSLLLRLYDTSKGKIMVDGQQISQVTQTSLRDSIAVVFQEPALFSGTIRENIAYGKPGATKDEIIAAAEAANAKEFIDKLDDGLDTEIGERGLKLSGGQKQRIAIARAVLKNAPILILDEATSSLDSRAEKLVQEALDRLMKGRTTLIIAHRLSTIADVDRIVTIRNGRVDEIGSPKKLSSTKGIYAQLLSLQNGDAESVKKQLQKFDIAAP